ncbi:unnamed protein product [Allacma fusca]|uniref:Uncharacterized protein n=1 Tax=Allacma fusca TaxID=39272 RepID=A0A8J2PBZ7_9HEXA|nr:unnamed protein product [Allacma fusca]
MEEDNTERTKNRTIKVQKFEEYLSLLTLKTAHKVLNVAATLKCIPFEPIPGKTRKYRLFIKHWQWLFYYLTSTACWCSVLHQVFGFIHYFHEHGLNTQSVVHILYLLLYLFFVIMHATIHFQHEEAVDLLNHTENLMRRLYQRAEAWGDEDEPIFHKGKWHSHPLAIMVVLYLTPTIVSIVLLLGVIHILNPTGEMYLLSLMPHLLEQYDIWLVMTGSCVIESLLLILMLLVAYATAIIGTMGSCNDMSCIWEMM